VTVYITPLTENPKYNETKAWTKKELPKFDKSFISVVNGPENVEPFLYFHNTTELAVKPIGEEFDNNTHPVISVNHQFGVDKFMNLKFNKLKLGNMTVSEIDEAVLNSGALKNIESNIQASPNQFEYDVGMTCGGC